MFKSKLRSHLILSLSKEGFEEPTELQKIAIPKIKSGADILCVSDDGKGKTSAIVISVIQKLDVALDDVPRAIIVVSTTEKGEEMASQFALLGENTDIRVINVKPVADLQKQKDKLYFGMDVVIGTAQLLNDLCSMNAINMNGLKMFIIDDADVVFKPENLVRVDRLAACIPKSQHLVFAKAVTDRTSRFVDRYMSNALVVEL